MHKVMIQKLKLYVISLAESMAGRYVELYLDYELEKTEKIQCPVNFMFILALESSFSTQS